VTVGHWQECKPGDVGISEDAIPLLTEDLERTRYRNIHSVLLARDGLLAHEWYGGGLYEDGEVHTFDRDTLHSLHSVTKTFTSTAIGIAIDRGLLAGLDVPLVSLFPDHAAALTGPKAALTVRHLATMTGGLRWDEETYPYTDARNDHVALALSDDSIAYAFGLPVVAEPGSTFLYSSALSMVLGEVVHRVSGQRLDEFAREHLFAPLSIATDGWYRYPNGVVQAGGGLSLRPIDAIKLGQLFLDGGQWDGQQVVSPEWAAAATRPQAPGGEYGYRWWLDTWPDGHTGYSARGRGGQFVFVVPEERLVAGFTGWNDGEGWDQAKDIMSRHVLPALGGIRSGA
jgi:CubicO group peptidase (beta-lactamase class C family)